MNHIDEREATVNGLIEAFEAAHADGNVVELTEFLPAADHSLYLEARRELLRVDLELSWLDGRRHRLDDYAQQFPDLFNDQATVQAVAFEEFRLRTLAGEAPSPADYEELYGVDTTGWIASKVQADESNIKTDPGPDIALLFNIARTIGNSDSWRGSHHGDAARALLRENAHHSNSEAAFLLAQAMTALPEIGSTFLDFHLIAELGRGSFGRVYLARQGDLANRLVALKITVDLLGEEQKLAQLQHTNVVPIYSVHQAGPFQAVCMPFFGPTTLADVIRAMQGQPALPTSGRDLVRTLRIRQETLPAALGGAECERSAHLAMLERSTHVQAVLAIAEWVTEGLIHAHERGILHRDLKPANILLTNEGRPMLVDFNLSADVKLHNGLSELQMGGTLPYMPPESLESMRGAGRSTDARSDIYALGVVLFELLTSRLPFETRSGPVSEILPPMIAERLQPPPRLRRWNAAISPAVESIVRHCLQPDPAKRYQSAQELHEDLKAQRQDRPLRHAPEPSISERAQKWVRRHPRLTAPGSIGAIGLFLVLCFMGPSAWHAWDQWQDANHNRDKIAEEEMRRANQKTQRAEGTALATKVQIDALSKFSEFVKTRASSRPIMEIISVMQMLPEAGPIQDESLAEAMAECQRSLQIYRVLQDAHWQRQPLVQELPVLERELVRGSVAELLFALAHAERISLARFRVQTQRGAINNPVLEAASRARLVAATALNARAGDCFSGKTAPWYLLYQKAALTYLAGDSEKAEALAAQAAQLPWGEERDEWYWAALERVAERRWADAQKLLGAATERSPDHAGAWLLLAWCHYNQDDSARERAQLAESCFDSYLKLQPAGVWGRYLRGLHSLRQNFLFPAEREKYCACAVDDFSKLLEKHPGVAWAYANRASARRGLPQNLGRAIEDLNRAIELAPEVPEFFLIRAQIYSSVLKNEKLAAQDRQHFLLHEPGDYSGWLYRGVAKSDRDPQGALQDLERALLLNPDCPLTLFHKARILAESLGQPKKAVPVLDRVIQLDPGYSDARFKRGILLAKLGHREEAVADAERLIEHERTPMRFYQAASIYAVTAPRQSGDAKRAIDLLSYALRHDYGVSFYQADPNLESLSRLPRFRRLAEGLEILGVGEPPRMRP